MPTRSSLRTTSALLLVANVLLSACAGTSRHPARGDLRFDTETAGRLRHAAAVGKGASAVAPSATQVVASNLARFVPILITLLKSDDAVGALADRLQECAGQAEHQVNALFFGDRAPTRAECGEAVDVDDCGEPITRAMLLGKQKHVRALQCAREVR